MWNRVTDAFPVIQPASANALKITPLKNTLNVYSVV